MVDGNRELRNDICAKEVYFSSFFFCSLALAHCLFIYPNSNIGILELYSSRWIRFQ